MLEELRAASGLLRTALNRYKAACASLHGECSHRNSGIDPAEVLGVVSNELDLAKSYKRKLKQAQVTVKRIKNAVVNYNTPTNALPDEVLTHIFHLVSDEQPCPIRMPHYWDSDSPVHLPLHPDALALVCCRWRQVALASHGLWAHIDIALSGSLRKQFHNRAVAYVARAHQKPLDIHFVDPGFTNGREDEWPTTAYDSASAGDSSDIDEQYEELVGWNYSRYKNNPHEFTFLSSSPLPQIASLALLVQNEYQPIHSRALEYCLVKCLPRGLSSIIINLPRALSHTPTFFDTRPSLNQDYESSVELSLSEEQLESAWHSTTALVLRGIYPHWTSSAYSGLTELRLYGKREISSPELIYVLRSSPGLRIFHCDFIIRDELPLGTLATPVALQWLDVLDLRGMDQADVEPFLRCLEPGSRSMRLSIDHDPTPALEDFFARSNVREMRVETIIRLLGESQLAPEMYYLPPQLQTLVLTRWGLASFLNLSLGRRGQQTHTSPSSSNEAPRSNIALDMLFMLSCRYDSVAQFHGIVARFSPRKLILWRCEIKHSASYAYHITIPFLVSSLGDYPFQLCPSIECLSSDDPNPLQDWD